MRLFVLILLSAAIGTACTSRVVYERPRPDASDPRANINTSTVEQLEHMPYVGRRTAAAIVDFREANGPFRRVEGLMLIRGISERRFFELRSSLKAE